MNFILESIVYKYSLECWNLITVQECELNLDEHSRFNSNYELRRRDEKGSFEYTGFFGNALLEYITKDSFILLRGPVGSVGRRT